MSELARWMTGAAMAVSIAGLAFALRSLSRTGAVAAAIMGTVAVAAGWDWAVLLVAYFVVSSALSLIGRAERNARTAGRIEKTGPRDARQVLANGGAFLASAIAWLVTGHPLWQATGAAALAASAADTWATEIGTLARASARSIMTGRVVPPGTSGGVTAQGIMAGIAGAAFIGAIATVFAWNREAVHGALVGGAAGMTLDSILGATLQSRRWCAACGTTTEQRIHRCGAATAPRGGVAWLDNDGVNALSTAAGAMIGAIVWTVRG